MKKKINLSQQNLHLILNQNILVFLILMWIRKVLGMGERGGAGYEQGDLAHRFHNQKSPS